MIDTAILQIAQDLKLSQGQVAATVNLLDDGASVPFIARYRKENTASLDEVAITSIRDRLSQIRELRDRSHTILESLEKRGLLTEELRLAILTAKTMTTLEDIYLPYRPKRRHQDRPDLRSAIRTDFRAGRTRRTQTIGWLLHIPSVAPDLSAVTW